jgi:flagellar basal-body rod modification protein FlgD
MQLLGPSAIAHSRGLALAQELAQVTNNTGGTTGTTGANSSSSSSTSSVSSLTSEQTFLQLLIAQIKNQDPLNPTDSIQFVGQLVQYSELEQLMGINQGVQNLGANTTTSPTKGTSSS